MKTETDSDKGKYPRPGALNDYRDSGEDMAVSVAMGVDKGIRRR
jgi:hypothetical protein